MGMMTSLTDSYTLFNGVEIPCVGFGTWQAESGDTAEIAVTDALRAGYRHIDTAAAYGNEESVGAGIRRSGISRQDIFLTTKLWNSSRGYDETIAACEDSMQKLGVDYLDLFLIHWPNPLKFRAVWKEKNADTWRAFEHLLSSGKVRSIGVSNFCVRHLDALLETADVIPHVNQIRICPGDIDGDTIGFCRSRNIMLEAYSPFGTGKAFESEILKEIAAKYGKSVAQICLNWSLHNGFLPLPKSVTTERIIENTKVFDFTLEQSDINLLTSLEGECGLQGNPDEKPF